MEFNSHFGKRSHFGPILRRILEATWSLKLANYIHFCQFWCDFSILRAVKFKMQIRLDKKCSFGQAAVGRVGGRGQTTGALTGWTLDSSGQETHTADISKLMRRI